ncbi:MAG: glycoside hydrolase family 127 protein [Clostridia bacterium]|nr:glycoside hydrolase family 127 protein [Clostridia bacterium]
MPFHSDFKKKDPASPRIPDSLTLGGATGKLAANIASGWLTGLRESNPAILDMFRDRDVLPYRDLLPWSGEFAGKHITGAYYVYLLTRSSALYEEITAFIDEMLTCQAQDGYLGCFSKDCRLTGAFSQNPAASGATWDAWNHYHIMTGLLCWYDLTGREEYFDAVKKIAGLFLSKFYDGKPPLASIGSTEMNLAPYHTFVELYERTGEEKYLRFAKRIEGDLSREDAGDYIGTALRGIDYYRCRKPRWESMHVILGVAEMYAATGDETFLRAARQITDSILRTDVHNTGAFSTNEQAIGNPFTNGAIETCCVVAYDALAARVAGLTADGKLFDHLERSHYNAILGSWSPTGRWSTYNTPMDGEKCANTHSINFQCRPGSPFLNCCSVNAPRGVGQCAEWMFTEQDGALVLSFYESLEADFGGTHIGVDSAYPAPGEIRIRLSGESRPFAVRIPGWSKNTRVRIGDKRAAPEPGTLFRVDGWEDGTEIFVDFDFTPYYLEGELDCAGKTSVFCGPVLYGADASRNPALNVTELPAVSRAELEASRPEPAPDGSILWKAGGVTLCDFCHLGLSGSKYRTWLTLR